MGFLLEIAGELLFSLFIEVFVVWTGELLLWAFTLGQRKPVFSFWKKNPRAPWRDYLKGSALAGFLFWVVVIVWCMA